MMMSVCILVVNVFTVTSVVWSCLLNIYEQINLIYKIQLFIGC